MTRWRRLTPQVLTIALFGVGGPRAGEPAGTIERLGWLAGCWKQEEAGRATQEQWMAPLGGTMLGMSRTVVGGRKTAHEFMRIEEQEGVLVLIAMPSGQKEDSFRQVELTDSGVAFANPAHDFPQRISYRLSGDGTLLARIDGQQEGRTRAVDFPMKRVACGPDGR